jgi:hypothetical protein
MQNCKPEDGTVFELLLVMLAIGSPIIVIVFIVQYFRYKADVNARLADLQLEIDSKATAELQEEVMRLKQRLNTVEMIVTDSSYELLQSLRAMEAQADGAGSGRPA